MKFLNNIKIRTKLLGSFLIVVLLAAVMGIIGIYNLIHVDKEYSQNITINAGSISNRFNAYSSFADMRRLNRDLIVYADDNQKLDNAMSSLTTAYNSLQKILDNSTSDATIDTNQVKKDVESYYNVCKDVHSKILAGNMGEARLDIEDKAIPLAGSINATLLNSYQAVMNLQEEHSAASTQTSNQTVLVMVIFTLLVLVVSIILAIIISGNITKPVYFLMNAAKEIADGNLNIQLGSNYRDEMSNLSNDLSIVVDNIRALVNDLTKLATEIDVKGDIDARLEESKFHGAYKEVAVGVNTVLGGILGDSLELTGFIKSYAIGDFSATVKQHVGKKVIINEGADLLTHNLTNLSDRVNELVKSASAGDLDTRIDASLFQNDWAKLVQGLNNVLEGVVAPVKETISVLESLSRGELNATVNGDYKGAYLNMKNAVNNTITILAKYINEISSTLDEMAAQNFDLEIMNDYIGDFAPIKTALNKIIDNLNFVLEDINTSAEQVASGARLISESSQSLAVGATEQAGAVQQLRSTIETIANQTQKNVTDAENADKVAAKAKKDADSGNSEMKDMLKAMTEINDASSNISKIIKVIDDIAFQTNLLALNAAVEAARAGQHGKGFAVVAEEVRSLAGRSKNAAQETTGLIQGTVAKVNEGTKIANKTAQALESIVHEITDISALISGVSEASKEQEESIQLINSSIGQIAEVTQINSATSEEEASSSEELSSQAEVFKQTVAKFNLRKKSSGSYGRAIQKSEPMEKPIIIEKHSEHSYRPEASVTYGEPSRSVYQETAPYPKNMHKEVAAPPKSSHLRTDAPPKSSHLRTDAPPKNVPSRTVAPLKTVTAPPAQKSALQKNTPPQPKQTKPDIHNVNNLNMPNLDYNRKDFGKY